ncbi:MAG: hypothetical protein LC789_05580 [Actinobacteria bacterium]|nr:hypothetical protein [Actinomycetota bacterium]MCA1720995.1 hypothetical protein [Actinomycetota bacterium]
MNSTTTLTTAALLAEKPVGFRASYVGLPALQAQSAPMSATHGTTVSAAVRTGVFGTDGIDVPGSPPREAPV